MTPYHYDFLRLAEQQAIANHHVSFFGSFAQQNPQAFISLNRLLLAHDFSTIIEIGCHDGGLSTFFALYCLGSKMQAVAENPNEPSLYKNQTHHKHPKEFYTFDNVIRDYGRVQLIGGMHGTFCKMDVLNDDVAIGMVRDLIKRPGTTLLLCDGGDKRREVALYAPALKPGDFIMAHDWARDAAAAKSLRDRGIWDAWETFWDEGPSDAVGPGIKGSCEANSVVQIYAEEFDDVAWFCARRQS